MKFKKYLFVVTILIAIILVIELILCKAHYNKIDSGIEIIKKEKGKIFASSNYIYDYNLTSKNWQVITNIGPLHVLDIKSNYILYINTNNCCLYSLKMDTNDKIELDYSFNLGKISNNGKQIVFSCFNGDLPILILYDIPTKTNKYILDGVLPNSISWGYNDKDIYYSFKDSIYKLDLNTLKSEFIVNGFFVTALSDNQLGFWQSHANGMNVYKIDLNDKHIIQVGAFDENIMCSSWDPTGRYVIAVAWTTVHGFLFIPKPTALPIILDSNENKKYILKETTGFLRGGFKPKNIIWENNF